MNCYLVICATNNKETIFTLFSEFGSSFRAYRELINVAIEEALVDLTVIKEEIGGISKGGKVRGSVLKFSIDKEEEDYMPWMHVVVE